MRKEGYLVAVGAPANDGYFSTLKLHEDGRLYEGNKEITKYPYMVLTIKASKTRDNYVEIPDVLKALQNLLAAIGTGHKESILEFYNAFTRVTRSSPDLLSDDAELLNTQIYKQKVEPALKKAQDKMQIMSEIDLEKAKKSLREIDLTIKHLRVGS